MGAPRPLTSELIAEIAEHAEASGADLNDMIRAYRLGGMDAVVSHGSFVSMLPMLTFRAKL